MGTSLVSQQNRGLIRRYSALYLLLIPCLAFLLIFRYYPILLQAVLAFKDFRLRGGVWGSEWIGFANFEHIFTSPQMLQVIGNTVKISLLRLLVGFFPPIILSIMLFDLAGRQVETRPARRWSTYRTFFPGSSCIPSCMRCSPMPAC